MDETTFHRRNKDGGIKMKLNLDVHDLFSSFVKWAAIGFSLSVGHWIFQIVYKYLLSRF
jgi:hypothetical protein